jgi:hypothetical protein
MEMKAARAGVVDAQYSVALCYAKGEGVKVDLREAFRWYLRAARKGHEYAAHNLARFYETGRGVRASMCKADHWYHRAKLLSMARDSK